MDEAIAKDLCAERKWIPLSQESLKHKQCYRKEQKCTHCTGEAADLKQKVNG